MGSREAVEREPQVEAEYRCEGQPALAGLTLAVVPMLREIYESDLRRILPARVGLVAVFGGVGGVDVSFELALCLLCSPLSTAAEIKLRQQLAERKADYRD